MARKATDFSWGEHVSFWKTGAADLLKSEGVHFEAPDLQTLHAGAGGRDPGRTARAGSARDACRSRRRPLT